MARPVYTRDHLAKDIAAGFAEVGDHTYGQPDIRFASKGVKLRIGKYCSIGPWVSIMLGGGHRADWVTTYPFPAFRDEWPAAAGLDADYHVTKGDVTIGNDVWIGSSVSISSGVTIGDGAIIANRSVVVKDVAPYTIVGGNPAQLIRERFAPHQVEALLRIRWWDWDYVTVSGNIAQLLDGDIDGFIAKHAPR